jgi:ABC-type nitrate/sulfonate/bicarbonate transport system substrate-binding protein
MKVFLAVVLAGLCLTVDASAVLAASVPPAKIVITPASFSEREGLLIVTQNQGYFRKRNLDVQLVLMPSAPIAFSALTAGESHFYYGTTSGTSLGAVLNGLDGVFVAGFINKLVGAFAVSKDIKTPNDLKGKQIGVASLGGGNWMFTMLAFDHWGLDPKRDNITFRIIGNTGVRAQSIASGIIGGSVLGYTFATNLRRDGYPILADLGDLNIPFQDTGLYTRKSFVAQHPEVVENVLRALLDGITFIQSPTIKVPCSKVWSSGCACRKRTTRSKVTSSCARCTRSGSIRRSTASATASACSQRRTKSFVPSRPRI